MRIGGGSWHTDPSQVSAFMAAFTTYLEDHPSLLGTLLAADYFQRVGQWDRAGAYLQKALGLREDCALCYYKLAYLANLRQQSAVAADYLQQAIELDAQFLAAYRALGGLYEKQGQYVRASQLYKRALNMAPDDAMLLNNLGWVTLVALEDPGTAYVYLRKAAALQPNDPDVRDSLAWWYYHNRDLQRAVQLLEPLANDYPTHPLYQYHMGMAYMAGGQPDAGRQHLRMALRHGLDGEAADRVREALR